MTVTQSMTKAELLDKIEAGWNAFTTYLATLTPEQLKTPTDAAGWTGKDHVAHLADWETSMLAMLNKQDRAAVMGIDKAMWNKAMADGDFDAINGIMQQRDKDKPLDEVKAFSAQAHQRLAEKVTSLSDEDLHQPYDYFQPGSGSKMLTIDWLYGNTFEHYDEHQSYIEKIVGDKTPMSKAELLEKIDQGWNDFQAYLMTLTPAQVTIPTDAAGWTALDHIIHLADWENGVLAMLNKQDRAAGMGVDAETWAGQDFDKINAILQKKSKDKSLQEAYGYVMGIHQQLVEKVQSMTDEALQRPYKYYQPQSDREAPVINWIQMNTFNHYAEHRPWIEAIVADRTPISKEMLLSRVQKGWDDLNAFLANLTDSQKTQPTDAAGWTVKDHMIHMAVWEDGVIALFDKEERPARMGVTQAVWDTHDDDQINAVIQKRYKDMPLADVEQKRQAIHAELVKRIETLSEALLHVPYREYNPVSSSKQPLADSVIGNTYMHYGDHTPWMAAIAAGGAHG